MKSRTKKDSDKTREGGFGHFLNSHLAPEVKGYCNGITPNLLGHSREKIQRAHDMIVDASRTDTYITPSVGTSGSESTESPRSVFQLVR